MRRAERGFDTGSKTKLICLIRHGKAAPKDIELSDFERPLTRKGMMDCTRVAEMLALKRVRFDLFFSSPADRALETAQIFAGVLNYPVSAIRIRESLYQAPSHDRFLGELKELDAQVDSVAVFGHNPDFDDLARYFISGFDRDIVKGAVLGITMINPTWTSIGRDSGRMGFFLVPNQTRESIEIPVGLRDH